MKTAHHHPNTVEPYSSSTSEAFGPRAMVLSAFGLLTAAAGIVMMTGCGDLRSPAAGNESAKGPPPIPVTATNAVSEDIPVQITGIGNARPVATVSVKSQIKGLLSKVAFKQGEQVHAGDIIFQIDSRPYDAALLQVRANLLRDRALLDKAQADFRRGVDLLKDKIISQAEFDQDRANVDAMNATIAADNAAVTNAEVQLDYCTIRSPITGRIGTLLVNEGNIVKDLDTVLAVINQLQPIYVDFSIPEQNLPEVRERMKTEPLKVEATVPGYGGHHAEGVLLLVNNEVDATTGTILLRAQFPNLKELLWPGQFVNVTMTVAMEHNVVTVPTLAVQLGQTGHYVCVVKPDQTVDFRNVEVGDSYRDATIVKTGLKVGEKVITSGQLKLVPGGRVRIIDVQSSGSAGTAADLPTSAPSAPRAKS